MKDACRSINKKYDFGVTNMPNKYEPNTPCFGK